MLLEGPIHIANSKETCCDVYQLSRILLYEARASIQS